MNKLYLTSLKDNVDYMIEKDTTKGLCPYMYLNYSQSNCNNNVIQQQLPSFDVSTNHLIPKSLNNGGLFNSPQSTQPWANIPIIPTEYNLIKNNLLSANPPPNAINQYISTDRLGNHSAELKGIEWFKPSLYSIHVSP